MTFLLWLIRLFSFDPAGATGAHILLHSCPSSSHLSQFFFPVLSIRQRLREKHARHVADLKAYYEAEIQLLQDKLKLRGLPQDVEKANQTLTKRCVLFLSVWFPMGLYFCPAPLWASFFLQQMWASGESVVWGHQTSPAPGGHKQLFGEEIGNFTARLHREKATPTCIFFWGSFLFLQR